MPSSLSNLVLGTRSHELQTKTAVIPINLLKTSRYQTRDVAFDNLEELENLANSIKTIGLLELPRVRKHPEDPTCYEIISGHRRIHAVSKFLGWKEIQCEIIEKIEEFDVFRLNVAENVQRSNLSAYEEGVAYLLCKRLFGLSDEEIAHQLHKSRQTIASKRDLAVTANQYVKCVDSSLANAFLRHFSLSHKELLNRLHDPKIIRQATIMIARGGTVRHLQRFVDLFGKEDPFRDVETSSTLDLTLANEQRVSPVEDVLSLFEEMKKGLPKKFVTKLNKLQNRYVNAELSAYKLSEVTKAPDSRSFACPECGEAFELKRKLIPEQDRVQFAIKEKTAKKEPKEFVYTFPIFYKVKQSS